MREQIEQARRAQQENEQKHDVQLELSEDQAEPKFITEARRIDREWQYATLHRETGERVSENHVNGILIDANTAHRMVQAYDTISNPNKCSMAEKIGVIKFATWVWTL